MQESQTNTTACQDTTCRYQQIRDGGLNGTDRVEICRILVTRASLNLMTNRIYSWCDEQPGGTSKRVTSDLEQEGFRVFDWKRSGSEQSVPPSGECPRLWLASMEVIKAAILSRHETKLNAAVPYHTLCAISRLYYYCFAAAGDRPCRNYLGVECCSEQVARVTRRK